MKTPFMNNFFDFIFSFFSQKTDDFEKAMKFVFKWEGGYVNDPDDPGGETKYGISKRANPEVNIRELTKDQAKEIYREKYWVASGADRLSWPLNLIHFDAAVNLGVHRAKRFLEGAGGDPEQLIARRVTYYRTLFESNPSFKKYFKGWMNRINDLRRTAA